VTTDAADPSTTNDAAAQDVARDDRRARIAPRYWVRKAVLTALFAGFTIVSAYLGFVRFPREHRAFAEYVEFEQLHHARQSIGLDRPALARYRDLERQYAGMNGPPVRRTRAAVMSQRFLCPVFAILTLGYALPLVRAARRGFVLRARTGELETPGRMIPRNAMTRLEIIHWGPRRLARLEYREPGTKKTSAERRGETAHVKLDGWMYAGMDDLIDHLESRLRPNAVREVTPDVPDRSGAAVHE